MSFNPVGGKGLSVQGLNEIIRSVEIITRQLKPTAEMDILREASTLFVLKAKERVHKVSGDLARSISVDSINPPVAIISAKTKYARKEEEREGIKPGINTEHHYMEPAARDVNAKMAEIIKRHMDDLFSANKTF